MTLKTHQIEAKYLYLTIIHVIGLELFTSKAQRTLKQ